MPTLHRPSLLFAGAIALVIGYLLRRWAGRHDLQGKATDAVWKSVRTRDTGAITGELKRQVDEISGAGSRVQQAKMVGGMAARHFLAQIVGLAGLLAIVAGIAATALAFLWK